MTGDTHYDLEILADLAEGLLDNMTAGQVREHLAICDPCGELLADLAAVREMLAATPTPAMPMGVALRIDRALAEEATAARGRGGVGLAEMPAMPDWEELMRDAPWETAARSSTPEPVAAAPAPIRPAAGAPVAEKPVVVEPVVVGPVVVEEPVRLGVVAGDGTVRPAKTGRRRAPRRRTRWVMPVVAAAASVAVLGGAIGGGLMAAQGDPTAPAAGGAPVAQPQAKPGYIVTDSGYTYSDADLKGPLSAYFAPSPSLAGESVGDKLISCVNKVIDRVGETPFQVEQAFYLGQEASIMAFWKDSSKQTVRVHVMGAQCETLRKPSEARW
ncbi:hypothetical protein [Sinosporangium siamense]|uniref:Zinc-finger n=1 Tax=Sinosporangium siamense TaxID=1367973 RepID=A0A919RRX9_9ACTN|nr:hypothetical protein [Sinosporangium siamense]GII97164.1 hypothetical protein Ssi02_73950 [Sinosporangium siamense]